MIKRYYSLVFLTCLFTRLCGEDSTSVAQRSPDMEITQIPLSPPPAETIIEPTPSSSIESTPVVPANEQKPPAPLEPSKAKEEPVAKVQEQEVKAYEQKPVELEPLPTEQNESKESRNTPQVTDEIPDFIVGSSPVPFEGPNSSEPQEKSLLEGVPQDTKTLEKKSVEIKKQSRFKRQPAVSMADVAIDTGRTLSETEGLEEAGDVIGKLTKSGAIHLGQYLEPWKGADPNELVEMNFDNKEISELLRFLSETLDITFILDDYIEPTRADGLQPLAGTKITFKSTVPLTLRQAWEIGLTFIEMAGFSVIPATQPRTYRVTVSASRDKPSANREPLPTFIGVDPELLPDTDAKIRYVYFAENAELSTIIQIIEAMKSGSAGPLIEVQPLRAVIITDKSAIIRSMMMILKEIDRVTLPEELEIIRLKHTDAKEVRELYYSLIGKDSKNPVFNPFSRQRKPSTTQYFSEATRVFEEPYTNSLIVLGTRDSIKRFEEFVIKHIDTSLDIPFSPLHIIQLKFIDAGSIAKILNDVIQRFNAHPSNSAAALVGGIRDGNKFFKPTVRITEEPSGNRLIINADYEEYLKLREIIEKLDVEQPQVAIKMLILNVDLTNSKKLGVQLRNSAECADRTGGLNNVLGTNVNFQTSMIGGIVTNPPAGAPVGPPINGAQRLLGNLINLANRTTEGISPFDVGTTLVTLGKDMFGFWGLLQVLESYTRTTVIANPFLVATHKYKAEFKVGETRRTTTAIVTGQRETQAQGNISADLRIVITPQISYDDMIELNVYVELSQFIDATTQDRLVRKVSTQALLANREVLAVGGLIRDQEVVTLQKVPVLGDIPLIGWLFKSEAKSIERTSLLILICPEIIKPHVAENFTFSKITEAKETLYSMSSSAQKRDPIHRWFFKDHREKEVSTIDKFVATQQRYIDESQRNQREIIAMTPPSKKSTGTPLKTSKKSLLDLVADPKGALV